MTVKKLQTPVSIGTINNREMFAVSIESPKPGGVFTTNSINIVDKEHLSSVCQDKYTASLDSFMKMTQLDSLELNDKVINRLSNTTI